MSVERQAQALERIADALERYLGLIMPAPKRTEPPEPVQDADGLWRIAGIEKRFYSKIAAMDAWILEGR